MTNKNKDELIEELQNKVEQLENDVDYWQSEYNDMEEERDDLQSQLDNLDEYTGIKDMDEFIFQLKNENLYSKELEEFINHYMKYHNN